MTTWDLPNLEHRDPRSREETLVYNLQVKIRSKREETLVYNFQVKIKTQNTEHVYNYVYSKYMLKGESD